MKKILCAIIVISQLLCAGTALCETVRLQGVIADDAGRPVAGAELFVYDSPKTRRPADYISPKTGADGSYTLKLPSGIYWGVARLRHGDKFGPLLSGDLHSGEPVEIDMTAGDRKIAFTVADIRELARAREKTLGSLARVSGRIIDQEGRPVAAAYVAVWSTAGSPKLPDMVSSWTESDGAYSLQLPPGRYAVAASRMFPPAPDVGKGGALIVTEGEKMIAFDVHLTKMEEEMPVEKDQRPVAGVPLADE